MLQPTIISFFLLLSLTSASPTPLVVTQTLTTFTTVSPTPIVVTKTHITGTTTTAAATGKLTNPPLLRSFKPLQPGLEAHLPSTPFTYTKWAPGWIPQACQQIAAHENHSASTIETYNVHYADCASPWILCRHVDDPDPIDDFFATFGRIPVKARSHVRGAISLPHPTQNSAYNSNNTIQFANFHDPKQGSSAFKANVNVFIHETGHSLDAGAFSGTTSLARSTAWGDALRRDSHVPDGYAQKSLGEDVAQSTVIATYDLNVPGGFRGLERVGWRAIWNQVGLVRKMQAEAGDVLVTGGRCTQRAVN
ncbi:MAG: hypothetical protein HETSPECPRED_000720, partial [Heterodermia speciosa]